METQHENKPESFLRYTPHPAWLVGSGDFAIIHHPVSAGLQQFAALLGHPDHHTRGNRGLARPLSIDLEARTLLADMADAPARSVRHPVCPWRSPFSSLGNTR